MVLDEDCTRGYDFSSRGMTDMLQSGIIDPVKVTKVALKSAVSVASTLMTTSNAIVETGGE